MKPALLQLHFKKQTAQFNFKLAELFAIYKLGSRLHSIFLAYICACVERVRSGYSISSHSLKLICFVSYQHIQDQLCRTTCFALARFLTDHFKRKIEVGAALYTAVK
jgi:hypothetical protein